MNSENYLPISKLEEFQGAASLDDLLLLSKSHESGTLTGYSSKQIKVSQFLETISSTIEPPLRAAVLSDLKDLAYMNPDQLNDDPNITAFVKKDTGSVQAGDFSAISSIHWTNGVIDEVRSVSLNDVKAAVTDINSTGDMIAKIDGTPIYNGLSVELKTTTGNEIAKVNGVSIYSGKVDQQINSLTDRGNDIIKVTLGTTEYTLKNGIDITPSKADGSDTQVGQEIFRANDIPVYNNLSVTSLVSNTNQLGDPIADINGNKIYNGVVLGSMTTMGQTIASINGQEIKNGINITKGSSVGSVIANVNGTDLRNGIEVAGTDRGDVIANVNGTLLRNGVNVDVEVAAADGIKIANIAGKDIYAPGTDISAVATSGTKIANVKTASGKLVDLFSGEHPHVHISQADYDTLKNSGKLDPNTYYFTEGRATDAGYDDVGIIYRFRSDVNSNFEYKWFELWPDGWCRQGGSVFHSGSTRSYGNHTLTCNFIVDMKDKDFSLTTQITKNGTKQYCNDTYTIVEFRYARTKKSVNVGVADTSSGTEPSYNVSYVVEGYYDTSKLNDILKLYPSYKTTLIGITNVKQTIAGGNAVVGQIVAYGGTDTPNGWLLCDGTSVDKSTYAELYAVIGDKFGTSKDTTKFILPKLTDSRYLQGYVTPGTPYSDGLPNITGTFGNCEEQSSLFYGAFKSIKTTGGAAPNGMNGYGYNVEFDASKSNSIYGAATSVRPKSLTVRYLICWKATENASGGGVIDGTVLTKTENIVLNVEVGKEQEVYTTKNDCGLYIQLVAGDYAGSVTVKVNGKPIFDFDELSNGGTAELRGNTIFVKKGSIISIYSGYKLTGKCNCIEYKLQSLAPQIAMPDWDENKKTNITSGTTIIENGWIVCDPNQPATTTTTATALFYVNDVLVHEGNRYTGQYHDRLRAVIPVAKGDIVKFTTTASAGLSPTVTFYPCKLIALKDCASYVVETWRSDNKMQWCRIYNDGWCEQGGKRVTEAANNIQQITLYQAYADTNYTIVATPCGTDLGDNEHQGIYIKPPHLITTTSFYYRNDLEKNEYVMWETKGYIN